MCDPVSMTAAAVGITAASSITQYMGARSQARAENQLANVQEGIVRDSYGMNDASMQIQQNQINEQSSQQMSERARQALIEQGRMTAAAADSGLTGRSQSRLMFGIEQANEQDQATLEANRENNIVAAQRNKDSALLNSRADYYRIRRPTQPSLLGVGLQIAGTAVGTMRPTSRMPTSPNIAPYDYSTYGSTPGSGP